jgi:hypothetical protein
MTGSQLRAGATALTLAIAIAAAVFVAGHLRNPAAPLQPPLPSAGQGLHLSPSVRAAGVAPVTSTYAS